MDDASDKKRRTTTDEAPSFGDTIIEDFRTADLSLRRDFRDLYQFYLDDEEQAKLGEMNQVQRWLAGTGWLMKSLVLKLPPSRRMLLLASLIFFAAGFSASGPELIAGFLLLMVVLLLELKDKMLAQDELAAGRQVQFALMPDEMPDFPGWDVWIYTQPANEVGGDMVDYQYLPNERLNVALGDISGKGLPAALFMAKLQATLRTLAPSQATLSDLGTEVNRIFCRDGLPGRFASLAYVQLEANNGAVRYLNAGHMPPLIIRDGVVEELAKGGPALGLSTRLSFSEQVADLLPDDVMFIYSDGLTEARNEAGAFFGEARLAALLPRLVRPDEPADYIGERLLRALDRFVGEAPPSDDLSLIILRRLAPPTEPYQLPPAEDTAVDGTDLDAPH